MKKTILKLTKVAAATMLMVATATIANAQGGVVNGGTDLGDSTPAEVPLDPNMTIMFVATAILFITYKFKKGELNMFAK